MNILYISNEYPPDTGFGGIGTYTKHAAEGMAARGHNVHVICRSVTGNSQQSTEQRVTVHRIVPGPYPLPSGRLSFIFRQLCYRNVPQGLVRLAWAKSVYRAVCGLIAEGAIFDIMEYPECGGEGHYLPRLGIPAVARLHTPWEIVNSFDLLGGPALDVKLQSRLERSSVKKATAVSSPTHALADRMSRLWHVPSITVYPNPLPAAAYARATGKGWIYIGRVERRKGVHVLIAAYARLCAGQCADRSPPPLTLIGRPYGKPDGSGGEYGNHIRNLISSLCLTDKIRWIEGVPQAAVKGYLCNSSVAFFPSLWENLSYACLEAMASGCAVVASRCGGFPEMIADGSSGFLVPPDDAEALCRAMKRFLDEPETASRLGDAARGDVRARFDSPVVCAQAETFYQCCIRKERHE